MIDVEKWAEYLFRAYDKRQTCSPITDEWPNLSVGDAYAIQAALIERRVSQGERIIGAKVGLTSRAKQVRMGVDVPIFGCLTDAMQLATEQPIVMSDLIHPRLEPEVVFLIGEELKGPGVSAHDVLNATEAVCGGMEIIDSRYDGFRFTLPDVIADNTSAARFVLGHRRLPPDAVDLDLLGVMLESGGEIAATAAGAAVLGHPAEAVALLANHLGNQGGAVQAGWVVLSGGLTDAVPLSENSSVSSTFAHLGSVTAHAVP